MRGDKEQGRGNKGSTKIWNFVPWEKGMDINMKSEKCQDTAYLDILRWIAISAVVMLHVVSGIADTIPEQMTVEQQIIYEMIKNMMTVGVPVFLMISGSLFLNPEKEIGIEKILKRYVPRILLALFLFGVPYAIMELIAQEGSFSWMMVIRGFFLTLSGNTWASMWYLYELVGIYLLTPFIKLAVNYGGKRFVEYGLALSFLFSMLFPFIEQIFGLHIGIVYQLSGVYLFYYVLGCYLHQYGTFNWRWCAGLFTVLECIIILNQVMGLGMEVQYNSLVTAAASAFLFLTFRNLKKGNAGLSAKGNVCFGIYLVHTFFLNVFYKLFHITPLEVGYSGILLFWILVFGLSLVTSEITQKIPVLRKYVV